MSKTEIRTKHSTVSTKEISAEDIRKALYGSKRSKYNVGNKESRTADNIVFDSIREMARYIQLKTLLRSGVIRDLELQPKFPIVVHDQPICFYVADFSYYDLDGRRIVEDTKGVKTPLFSIKAKLFHACYPHLRILLS